ncbi:hypothetical protein SDC9_58128 [bioreactor metagenome]|uniref:Uncharacterized protein n=1 Tax=bioreactor metagenome TaxID=1076179 RepID=A0A644X775_9ZZZZ
MQGGNDFREVMRRDVCRHPNGDTGSTVHQEVREAGRQYIGFTFGTVIVVVVIDCILVEVAQHFQSDF